MLPLTIENLKAVDYTNIAIFNSTHLAGIIKKNFIGSRYYDVVGSDEGYNEEELLKYSYKDQTYYICNADLIKKPVEVTNSSSRKCHKFENGKYLCSVCNNYCTNTGIPIPKLTERF